jgi:hypothetical protein
MILKSGVGQKRLAGMRRGGCHAVRERVKVAKQLIVLTILKKIT